MVAGHHRAGWLHWRDSGALPRFYNGNDFIPPVYNEHHESEKLVTEVAKLLRQHNIETIVCPFTYNLKQKIAWERKVSNGIKDILISVHFNGFFNPEATGTEVFYFGGDTKSMEKALIMSSILSGTMVTKDRGAKPDTSSGYGRLGIIRDTKSWAFLFEMGFITNKEDMKKVRNVGVQALYEAVKQEAFVSLAR